MPRYSYQCSCGIQFEAMNSVAKHQDPKPCPSCGQDAPRLMPTGVNSVWKKEVTGPTPQNTGVHDLDTHIDRVIGQSAAQGWNVAERRVSLKRQVLVNEPGATGHDLSRNPDGSYRVLSPEERAVHERANTINSLAMKTLKGPRKKPVQ